MPWASVDPTAATLSPRATLLQAEAEELAAALALEREELALLRAQAGELRLAGAAASERLEANARFIQTSRWCAGTALFCGCCVVLTGGRCGAG